MTSQRNPARNPMLDQLFLSTLLSAQLGALPPSESLLVSNLAAGTIDFVDVELGERRLTIRLEGGPGQIAVAPDGLAAVVTIPGDEAVGDSIGIIDLVHQSLTRTIELKGPGPEVASGEMTFWRPRSATFVPTGEMVLVASEATGTVVFISLDEARVVGSAYSGGEKPQEIVISADGRFALVSNQGSGTVGVINLARRRLEQTIEVGGDPGALALSPDRSKLWVANRGTNSISVIDMATSMVEVEFPCGSYPVDLTFTPDGAHVLCANLSPGSISVFDTASQKATAEIIMPIATADLIEARPAPDGLLVRKSGMPIALEVSEDGQFAWVVMWRLDEIVEVSIAEAKISRRIPAGVGPTQLVGLRLPSGPRVQSK